MSIIGFARVSTIDQDLALQLKVLKAEGCQEIFHGKQSGVSDENEAKLAELIRYIRKDDVVLVTKLDRLGRSLKSILSVIDDIHVKQATLRTLDGVINTSNSSPFAKATISLIGVFAQLERDLIVSRTSEGRAAAAAAGKHMGRPKQISDNDRAKIRRSLRKGHSVSSQASKYGVSRTTIARIRNENNG
jgi:DNA invertase Pin-like site-specific DNA recombinase